MTAPLRNQRGFALLISLLVIILLVVIIFEADFQTRADLRAAGNFRDDLKAYYLARAALSAGEALLKDDAKNSNRYDGLDEFWAFPISEFSLGDGVLSGVIIDEERKINLNFLVKKTGGGTQVDPARKAQLERLFERLQVDPQLVDPIVDWVDSDTEPLPFGAEDDTYQRLDPPYAAKNGPFDTLEELHMVHGVTDAVYRKISPYLTVYGRGRININTADSPVIESFDTGLDETEARRLADKRPFTSTGEFREHLKKELSDVYERMLQAGSLGWMTTRSSYFSLTGESAVDATRKRLRAVIRRTGPRTELLYFRVD